MVFWSFSKVFKKHRKGTMAWNELIHFQPMFHSYTPLRTSEDWRLTPDELFECVWLMFLGSIEGEHWLKMGWYELLTDSAGLLLYEHWTYLFLQKIRLCRSSHQRCSLKKLFLNIMQCEIEVVLHEMHFIKSNNRKRSS